MNPQHNLGSRTTFDNVLPMILLSIVLLGLLVVMPAFVPTFVQRMLGRFLIMAVFSISYNIIAGYTGLISLGQAAYFGAGAYTVAILWYHFGIDLLWITAPSGVLVATASAALLGLVALRVAGMYFLILTFAIGQLFYSLVWNIQWFNVPGMQGIGGLPRPNLGIPGFAWTNLSFYYFLLLVFLLALVVQWRLTRSPFGYSLRGIREGEKRMRALGYNIWLHKYLSFVISGAFAGLAGVLFVYQNRFVEPAHLGILTSFLPMAMVIVGGPGTLWGPVLGSAAIVFVEYYSSILVPARWPMILGAMFVLTIMFAPKGLVVYGARGWKRLEAAWKR